MTEAPPAAARPHIDTTEAIEALRERGAARFDPVGFRFIEALARRTTPHRDDAARVLERRLASVLADFSKRFDRAESAGNGTGDRGEFQRIVTRRAAQGCKSPLAELLAHIEGESPGSGHAGPARSALTSGTPRGELKAMAYFRSTWSRLSVDRQLSRSLAQAPANAGPLNSEFLLLQALTSIRDISPDYLRQFMTYADTLLWLDQAESGRAAARKGAGRSEREKKRKQGKDKA